MKDLLLWILYTVPYVFGFIFIVFFGFATFEWMRNFSGFSIGVIYILGGVVLRVMIEEYTKHKD